MATRAKIEQEIKEKYEKRYSARIAELQNKLAEYRETIQQLRLDLQIVTKSRDHYMEEFDRYDKGYWEVVSDRNIKQKEIERLQSELEDVVYDLRQEKCYSSGLKAELEGQD